MSQENKNYTSVSSMPTSGMRLNSNRLVISSLILDCYIHRNPSEICWILANNSLYLDCVRSSVLGQTCFLCGDKNTTSVHEPFSMTIET